jgi:hypothetical protein
MREKLRKEIHKMIDTNSGIRDFTRKIDIRDGIKDAINAHVMGPYLHSLMYYGKEKDGILGGASHGDAIRAILNHLNLELHGEPSKPESVVARKKAK